MFKNDKVFDFNSKKIPNVLNLNLKSDKLSKINYIKKILYLNYQIMILKDLDLKINVN